MFRIATIASVLLVLLSACEQKTANGGPPVGFSRGPTYVLAEQATVREIRDEVEAIGTTRANESVTIAAKVTDTISRVNFDDGAFVSEGDVLVELTNREQSALLDEAEANVQDAGNQVRRLESMAANNLVPLSELDAAVSRLAGAEARYQSIVARLEDRLIRAPFTGLLGFREVSEGTLVTPGSLITTLDDISVIKLDFSIPEVYLELVREGLSLEADSSAFPGRMFSAEVRTIGSRIDESTRAATIRAQIDNDDGALRPGMLMTVHMTTDTRKALMVPETAIMQRSSQVFAYIISRGAEGGGEFAEMVQLKVGARRDGFIEVLSGLEAGERVITDGVIKVRNGTPVTTEPPASRRSPGGAEQGSN